MSKNKKDKKDKKSGGKKKQRPVPAPTATAATDPAPAAPTRRKGPWSTCLHCEAELLDMGGGRAPVDTHGQWECPTNPKAAPSGQRLHYAQ